MQSPLSDIRVKDTLPVLSLDVYSNFRLSWVPSFLLWFYFWFGFITWLLSFWMWKNSKGPVSSFRKYLKEVVKPSFPLTTKPYYVPLGESLFLFPTTFWTPTSLGFKTPHFVYLPRALRYFSSWIECWKHGLARYIKSIAHVFTSSSPHMQTRNTYCICQMAPLIPHCLWGR